MPSRNVILRVMLWCLGLVAFTGVLSVFFQDPTFMWRIIGTEFSAAVACLLMLPCITRIDKERTRAGGLLGMACIMVEFILALTMIWEIPKFLWNVRWGDELFLTMILLAMAIVITITLLDYVHLKVHRVTTRLGLAITIMATCAFLIAIWIPGHTNEEWAFTGFAIATMGTIITICLHGMDVQPRKSWRGLGVCCGVIALAMWLYDIWIGPGSDFGFVTFTGLLIVATVIAYMIVCFLGTLNPSHLELRQALMVVVVIFASMIELLVIENRIGVDWLDNLWLGRCTAASGIMTACGTLALVVLTHLNRKIDYDTGLEAITNIKIECPRCKKKQSISIGDAMCSSCYLNISVRVEEPHCSTCDYLLIGITSDRCPECGTEIQG